MKPALIIILCILILPITFAATIDSVSYSVGELHEGQWVELTVTFQGAPDGELKLMQQEDLILKQKAETITKLEFEVPPPVKTADGDDMFDWKLFYYENGVQKDKKELGQFWGALITVQNGEEGYTKVVPTPTIPTESSWGSIDFRVLISEKDTEHPVEVVIQNKLDIPITAKITLNSISIDGSVGTSKNLEWPLNPGQNNRQIEFNVKESEKKDDIEIIAEYNGKKISDLQNTLIRLDPDYIKDGKLPPRPGEILDREIEKKEQELLTPPASKKANYLGIAAAAILFILFGALLFIFFRKRR